MLRILRYTYTVWLRLHKFIKILSIFKYLILYMWIILHHTFLTLYCNMCGNQKIEYIYIILHCLNSIHCLFVILIILYKIYRIYIWIKIILIYAYYYLTGCLGCWSVIYIKWLTCLILSKNIREGLC